MALAVGSVGVVRLPETRQVDQRTGPPGVVAGAAGAAAFLPLPEGLQVREGGGREGVAAAADEAGLARADGHHRLRAGLRCPAAPHVRGLWAIGPVQRASPWRCPERRGPGTPDGLEGGGHKAVPRHGPGVRGLAGADGARPATLVRAADDSGAGQAIAVRGPPRTENIRGPGAGAGEAVGVDGQHRDEDCAGAGQPAAVRGPPRTAHGGGLPLRGIDGAHVHGPRAGDRRGVRGGPRPEGVGRVLGDAGGDRGRRAALVRRPPAARRAGQAVRGPFRRLAADGGAARRGLQPRDREDGAVAPPLAAPAGQARAAAEDRGAVGPIGRGARERGEGLRGGGRQRAVAFGGRWTDAAGATDTSDVLYGHGLTADWTFGLARQPCGCAAIAQAMKAWAQNRIDELPHANGTFVVLQRHSNSTREKK
eukprot:CAMPEP_0174306742 /NCGR_PEP_ID=MMETSP0810-20121108/654_1 /TAXON_ID=73025 ORGANISM="Eutreptiella gymnastica-like, Strain CCMP1594" /NCGR_SAMPLE_ID=MMETSP0810 /ASSEMBLY_ACC=CAM_ASM_000659 /LENGTH=422 /DNA_ID=CAMNT_0015413559 /DNA_START=3277 /DNA_END=4542 /DNA_ORIENTATION=-